MKRAQIPGFVRDKLDELERAVEHLNETVSRTEEGIGTARSRLSGAFKSDAEYNDVAASLQQMVEDLPALQKRLGRAKVALVRCQQFVAELLDDAVLEPVKVAPNGHDRRSVDAQLKVADDELKTLQAVPVPSSDIEQRVKEYVASLGRPKVSGVANGKLEVSWPNDNATSLLAILMPEKMVEVILGEVERQANTPLPLDQRQRRIAELRQQIDMLQRQVLALDPAATGLPAEVLLGVRLVPPGQGAPAPVARRIERRRREVVE